MPESVMERTVRAGETISESIPDLEHMRSAISAAVDDGLNVARRAVKRGRHAAGDMVEEATHGIKRYPLQTAVVTFGVGLGAGVLFGWFAARARK